MPAAKKPQDNKPKLPKGTILNATVDGIDVTLTQDVLDDFELLDDFAELQNGNNARIVSAMKRMFGEDYARILEELRDESGKVKASRAMGFFVDVMKAANPNS